MRQKGVFGEIREVTERSWGCCAPPWLLQGSISSWLITYYFLWEKYSTQLPVSSTYSHCHGTATIGFLLATTFQALISLQVSCICLCQGKSCWIKGVVQQRWHHLTSWSLSECVKVNTISLLVFFIAESFKHKTMVPICHEEYGVL